MLTRRVTRWLILLTLIGVVAGVAGLTMRGHGTVDMIAAIRAADEGRVDEAREVAYALAEQPDQLDASALLRGVCLLRENRITDAMSSLHLLRPEGELRPLILRFQGEGYYRNGQLAEAIWVLQQLVHDNPDDVDGHRWLASACYDLGNQNAAIVHLHEVARLAPTDYRPHWMLGVILRDGEQYTESVKELQTAWSLNPPEPTRSKVAQFLVRGLHAEHRYQDALDFLASLPPDNNLKVLTAVCQFNLSQVADADDTLRGVTEPEDRDLAIEWYKLRAELLDLKQDSPGLIKCLEEATSRFVHDEKLRYRYAMALKAAALDDAAQRELDTWKLLDERKRRLIALNQQATREPDNPEVRLQLAAVCRELGHEELAVMWESAAIACRRSAELAAESAQTAAE